MTDLDTLSRRTASARGEPTRYEDVPDDWRFADQLADLDGWEADGDDRGWWAVLACLAAGLVLTLVVVPVVRWVWG